jgi:hypothetical protein
MFWLYRAIIKPYLKNRSISFFCTFGIPKVYIDSEVIKHDRLFFTLRLKTSFKILIKSMSMYNNIYVQLKLYYYYLNKCRGFYELLYVDCIHSYVVKGFHIAGRSYWIDVYFVCCWIDVM